MDLAEQFRADIRDFKKPRRDRLMTMWCGSTESYIAATQPTVGEAFEKAFATTTR